MSDQGQRRRARDTETGEIVEFQWLDSAEPTDDDIAEVFAAHRARKSAATDASWGPSFGASHVVETAKGVATGLGQMITGGGDAIREMAPWTAALDVDTGGDRSALTPKGQAQEVGAFFGRNALAAIPAVRAGQATAALTTKAPAAIRLGAQMLAGAGTNTVTGRMQGHDSPATDAMIGAAGPLLGGAALGTARVIGRKALPLAQSALKTPLRILRSLPGAAREGADKMSERIANTVLNQRLFNADAATEAIEGTMGQINEAVKRNAGVIVDAPQRAVRYLQALGRGASKSPLPQTAQSAVGETSKELLDGPYGQAVQIGTKQSIVPGPGGQRVLRAVPVMGRGLRSDVTLGEAREASLAQAKYSPSKWGGTQAPGAESAKAVERASRDAVKAGLEKAEPGSRALFDDAQRAIKAREALRLMGVRDANRDAIGPYPAIGIMRGDPKSAILGFAAQWLKNNQLKAGIYANDLQLAITKGDVVETGRILQKLGVAAASDGAQ